MTTGLLEVCVDTADGLRSAIDGGADRIELCSALTLGGLTPSQGLIQAAAAVRTPVRAMIRPRGGSFVFTQAERDVMRRDIDAVRAAGLEGVVMGAATEAGALDMTMLQDLVAHAAGLAVTLHRVVDLLPDGEEAVDAALALGVSTILTSGGALKAVEGCDRIGAMRVRANGNVEISAGAGVSAQNVGWIVTATGVRSVHASCSRVVPAAAPRAVAFGFASPLARETDADLVASLRNALKQALATPAEPA